MDFNSLKQLGLKTVNQLIGQIKEYCSNTVSKCSDYGQMMIAACNNIDVDVNTGDWKFDRWSVPIDSQDIINGFDEVMLKYAQAEDPTKTLSDQLDATFSDAQGRVFTLTRDAAGNYYDGANNLIYNSRLRILDPNLTNLDGQTTSLAELGRDLLNNTQIYDTISRVSDATIDQSESSFNNILNRLELDYGSVSDDARYIVDSCQKSYSETGASGVLAFIKNWFESMNTMQYDSEEHTLGFGDNSAFLVMSNLAGCIGGAIMTGLQIVGSVLTTIVPIVGIVISTASKVVGSILNFAASAVDANALGTIRWKENGNYEYPISLCQWVLPLSAINRRSTGFFTFYSKLLSMGSLSINVPGGDMLLWVLEDQQNFCVEFHVTPFMNSFDLYELTGQSSVFVGSDISVPVPSSATIWEYYASHCDASLSTLKNTRWDALGLDGELKDRYMYNYTILNFFIWSSLMSEGEGRVFLSRNAITNANTASWSFYNWLSALDQGDRPSWEDICNPQGSLCGLTGRIQYEGNSDEYMLGNYLNPIGLGSNDVRFMWKSPSSSTFSDMGAVHSLFKSKFWTSSGALYYSVSHDVIDYSPIVHFGDYYVDTPKTSFSSVIGAIIITSIIAVAAIVAVNVTKKAITKAKSKKKAELAAGVESSWQDYLANPSGATYDAYYKSVRKNNRWAKFLGGTNYSLDGMWGSAEDGGSDVAATAGSTLANLRDMGAKNQLNAATADSQYEAIIAKLDQLITLITG